MDSFFRAVAIGLGVLMGTFNPGVEPELKVAVHKSEATLQIDVGLMRALSPKMEEALEEGVPMALTLQTFVDGRPGPAATQVLAYRPLTRQWQVARDGLDTRALSSRIEAESLWLGWANWAVGPVPAGPFTLEVRVELSFPDRPDWKADMVWKVPVIRWLKAYSRPSEIPF